MNKTFIWEGRSYYYPKHRSRLWEKKKKWKTPLEILGALVVMVCWSALSAVTMVLFLF